MNHTEFTKVMYPDDRHREFLRRAMTLGPEIGKDESNNRISNMITRNEQRNSHKSTANADERECLARIREKGKSKSNEVYTSEDIENLRKHWYEDYEDLLQGVPDHMPPWRVVNHENPLD